MAESRKVRGEICKSLIRWMGGSGLVARDIEMVGSRCGYCGDCNLGGGREGVRQ